jgi:CRISPR-associated protein Cmr5
MTRQQKWAKHAYDCLQNPQNNRKYHTLCMKAPSLIRQAGLVQAIAFLQAREGDEGKRLVDEFAKGLFENGNGQQLLERASRAGLLEYMALSRDAANLAVWFRRFAQSLDGNTAANQE